MSRQNYKAPRLPAALLDQVAPNGHRGGGRGRGRGNSSRGRGSSARGRGGPPRGRKELRKAERDQKKQTRWQPKKAQHRPLQNGNDDGDDELIEDPWGGDSDGDEFDESERPAKKAKLEINRMQSAEEKPTKSVLKKAAKNKARELSPSPAPVLSRAVKSALEQDDAEIAFLEKKLGVKGKKRSRGEDGLDDLLDGIDDILGISEGKKTKKEDDEWLKSKRKIAGNTDDEEFEEGSGSEIEEDDSDAFKGFDDAEDSEIDEDESRAGEDMDVDEDYMLDLDEDESMKNAWEEAEEEDDDNNDEDEPEPSKKARENPYRPPVPASSEPTQKYIPPSLRSPAKDDQELLTRIRRQLQGLLNRLSEANLLSILKDVENVFNNNPRQHVISSLIDLLMDMVCDRTSLMDTFIVLHAGFISAVYKVIGPHFAAQLLERIITDFRTHYEKQKVKNDGNKECSNLIALLAEMYTFQVISSVIMYDFIRLFLSDLSDLNTELLLKLVKNCGPQLRSDDPLALKDIIFLVQKAVAAKSGEANLPVRTKFMIETISNLKNNKLKSGPPGSNIASEHITRLKKAQGVLNARNSKATEPLGVSLKEVENADKSGKWWLVGASWRSDSTNTKDNPDEDLHEEEFVLDEAINETEFNDDSTDLVTLAKQHRMNTQIRRTIFTTIMSATDYKDAYLRLRRLKLKKAQQFEIPRILVHCAGSEERYNPYYRLIAKKLCVEHKFRKAMQFNLWGLFRRLGEKDNGAGSESDDDDDEGEDEEREVNLRELVNLGKLYGELVAWEALPITVLKILDFVYLQPKTKTFLEVFLVTTLQTLEKRCKENEEETKSLVKDVFEKAKETPDMVPGLQYFLKNDVKGSPLAASAGEKKALRRLCRTAVEAVTLLDQASFEV